MKNLHEYVYYLDGLPIRVFVHNQHYVPPHWHKEIELLLVLSGRAQISIGQLRLDAAEDDVVIVNCNEVHSTSSAGEEPLIIAGLQIDPEFCGLLLPDIARIWFRNGALLEREGKQSAMDWLRYYLARIIWETIETDEGYQVALQGMAYLIISYLTRIADRPPPQPRQWVFAIGPNCCKAKSRMPPRSSWPDTWRMRPRVSLPTVFWVWSSASRTKK